MSKSIIYNIDNSRKIQINKSSQLSLQKQLNTFRRAGLQQDILFQIKANCCLFIYLFAVVLHQLCKISQDILQFSMSFNNLQADKVLQTISQSKNQTVAKVISLESIISKAIYKHLKDQKAQDFYISIYNYRHLNKLQKNQDPFSPKVHYQKITEKQQENAQNYLLLKTQFQEKQNIYLCLRKLQIHNNEQSKLKKAKLINEVVIKLLINLMTRSNFQLYSTSKVISIVYNQDKNQVSINFDQASIAGFNLLLLEQDITVQEFEQIYQLLTTKVLLNKRLQRFSFQQKIRSIAKIIIELMLGRKISFAAEIFKTKEMFTSKKQLISFANCLKLLAEMKETYKEFLTNKGVVKRIEELQKMVGSVDYKKFLWDVFVEEKDLTWTEVIQLIVPKISNLTTKPIHVSKVFTFQKIMEKFQKSLQFTKGQQYIELIKELGLYNQFKPLFIALMFLNIDFAYEAICYQDLTQLIYCPNNFDFQVRDEIYNYMNSILGDVAKYLCKLYEQKEIENEQLLGIPKSSSQPALESEQPAERIEGQWQDLSQQFEGIQNALAVNYGRLQMRIKKSKFISQNFYALGFSKYSKSLL